MSLSLLWITESGCKGPDQAQAIPQSSAQMVRTRCTEDQFLYDNLENSCVHLRLCWVRGKEELSERLVGSN